MYAPTHITFGLLTTTASFALAGQSVHRDWPAIGATVLGSLLPDIDSPRSLLGRLCPWVAAALERWRHRSVTHSLLALSGLALLALPLSRPLPSAYSGLLIGCGSHLLLDSCTLTGTVLFWPVQRVCVLPGNARFRIEVGSLGERVLLLLLIGLLLVTLPLSAVGGVWKAIRYLTAAQSGAYDDYLETTHQAVVNFRGRWAATHEQVRARAPILAADATRFLIVLDGRVVDYGPRGDLLPIRTRLQTTDLPIRVDTLEVLARAWSWIEASLDKDAWVSGILTADRAFADQDATPAAVVGLPPGIDPSAVDPPGADRPSTPDADTPAYTTQSATGARDARQELVFEFAPASELRRLHPVAAIDPERARTADRRVARARAALTALYIRRPPAHYLEIRAAANELVDLQRECRQLSDTTVRFTGHLYLRHLPEDL